MIMQSPLATGATLTPEERKDRLRHLPAPTPSMGADAYRQVVEAGLRNWPERQANYERFLTSSRRTADPDYLPIKLDIENVSRCNFRCTMCSVSEWPKGQRAPDLCFEAFKRLIDEQIGLVEIKLQGLGEPSMQREPYYEMIRYARARDIWVRTTTNASLLHLKIGPDKRPAFKELIDADPNEVQVSVDGATKEVFEGIRQGSKFKHVVRNCAALNAYSREVGVTRTKMWTVVQHANYHQLEDLVRLTAELGFKHHTFSLELVGWGRDDWVEKNESVNVEALLDPDHLMSLVDLGNTLGVEVRFWNTTEKYATDAPESLCPWPFERSFIGSDLRVVPCCMIGNPDVFQIDRKMDSFSEVWTGEDYREFRLAHLSGNIPHACQECYKHANSST